ncbi:zinc metalloproteinase nas-8-like isoform X2 [Stegodyphus dumicola]|uniref:zinc metalloproteinase nas-8-like isoform X2 n=1 Tax=Stegodyphus dumicola TaxID=202533 RepID=UPI0015B2B171|nr:zinc metalloproteinase nas-8-like isoform X2 [Stegodyphus dumicola]
MLDVGPEYLDMLLQSGRYEEFSKHMKIEDVDLVRPTEGKDDWQPMFNKGLKYGDILLSKEQLEEERQGIRHDGGYKWPRNKVPYAISSTFSVTQRRAIVKAIEVWNNQVQCVKFVPRKQGDKDYVLFFPGKGCYSYMGRRGGKQPISLDTTGCLKESVILHELDHAIGFAHEQSRFDRDKYINVLYENIPEDIRPQYAKTDSKQFNLQGSYDYYSLMHYPVNVPGTNKLAFTVLDKNINLSLMGHAKGLTQMDLQKIRKLYC